MSSKNIKLYPVLIAGGSGTRLWPVSRERFPKQLVCFFGKETLIQNTIQRLLPCFEPETIRVVCGQQHSHDIARDMEALKISAEGKIIGEPCGRNTAPAILLAVLEILKQEKDAVIFIFPSDHLIRDVSAFHEKIKTATNAAIEGLIVTFGITPNYPETGYGYIAASDRRVVGGFLVKRFVEKPDFKTAEKYLKAGNFYWNSGMFAFKASAILEEFKKFCPEIVIQMQEMVSGKKRLSIENYSRVENISIDYGIMEHTTRAMVLPSDFGWSDIGSWKSLYDYMPKDKDRNVVVSGDVILQNTRNSFVMGGERLIALNHLKDIVVVETSDSVFVSDVENSRDVKSIVDTLKEKGRKEYRVHTTVYEPWGYYKILESTHQLNVKRMVLYSKARIHDRIHENRSTKWFVLGGAARVEFDQTSVVLKENQAVYIPENRLYRLENIGKTELHGLEITTLKKNT